MTTSRASLLAMNPSQKTGARLRLEADRGNRPVVGTIVTPCAER
jgi:hypothetical protein